MSSQNSKQVPIKTQLFALFYIMRTSFTSPLSLCFWVHKSTILAYLKVFVSVGIEVFRLAFVKPAKERGIKENLHYVLCYSGNVIVTPRYTKDFCNKMKLFQCFFLSVSFTKLPDSNWFYYKLDLN